MSDGSNLNDLAHARFRQAFGEPHGTLAQGEQWSLWPDGPTGNPINVFVDGCARGPVVWVFDPHRPEASARSEFIAEVRQIDLLIELIEDRVRRASAGHRGKRRGYPNPPPARSPQK